jgi:hypothetical protein
MAKEVVQLRLMIKTLHSTILTEATSALVSSIILHTRNRIAIDNCQPLIFTKLEESGFADLKKRYPAVIPRNAPTPIYNCHGMTFASRRTAISEDADIRKIIDDDGYTKVHPDNIAPGDVVLYVDDNGGIEHSAIVVSSPKEESLGQPLVVSKWGKFSENIHYLAMCPYSCQHIEYYRVTK